MINGFLLNENASFLIKLVTLNGLLGDYSIGLLLTVAAACVVFLMSSIAAIIKIRGAGHGLVLMCSRDVLFAVACAVVVLAFPGFFFFMGRAFKRALSVNDH